MPGRRIGGFFGRSAFGPLREHLLKGWDCVELIEPLLGAYVAGDPEGTAQLAARMNELEGEADRIKFEIRSSLSDSVFASTVRADVLALTRVQDRIPDTCEHVATLLTLRETKVPAPLDELLLGVGRAAREVVRLLVALADKLLALDQEVPNKKQIGEIFEAIEQVHVAEHNADIAEQTALKELFRSEKSLEPVGVLFLYDIIRQLGQVADEAENTVDFVRQLVARRT